MFRFSTLLCLLLAAPVTEAFVPTVPSARSSLVRRATVEDTAAALKPEFAAATDAARAALKAKIPEEKHSAFLPLLNHFVGEYMGACQVAFEAGDVENSNPAKAAERIMTCVGYGLTYGVGPNKFTFDVSHTAFRGDPKKEDGNEIDFYEFGCDFFRPCMNMEKSKVLGLDNLEKALAQIEAGENVVFLANHQSEADPQVVSVCLESIGKNEPAADIVYVAGHKVTTDPLAIPFSMGRNLVCIHSKKHINAVPEEKQSRSKQNLRSMGAMLDRLKKGGCMLWVAPSGGRDRRDLSTGKVPIAPFDSKTIDMFRLMGNKSKVKTHFYTLAMVSYELCPPPDFIDPGVGEQRNVRYTPVGIAVGEELESVGGLEHRKDFCDHAFAQCQADYDMLQEAIEG